MTRRKSPLPEVARVRPPRPDTAPKTVVACLRGTAVAEELTTKGRERLVSELWDQGWTDQEIAAHSRMTTYTTARIRDRIGLAPRRRDEQEQEIQPDAVGATGRRGLRRPAGAGSG